MNIYPPHRGVDNHQRIQPQDILAQPLAKRTCDCQLPPAVQQDDDYNLSQDDSAEFSTSEIFIDTHTC